MMFYIPTIASQNLQSNDCAVPFVSALRRDKRLSDRSVRWDARTNCNTQNLMKVPLGSCKYGIKPGQTWSDLGDVSMSALHLHLQMNASLRGNKCTLSVITLLGYTGCLCKYCHRGAGSLHSSRIYEWGMDLAFQR